MTRVCLKRGVVVTAAWVVGVCGGISPAGADELRVLMRVGDSVPLGGGITAQVVDLMGYPGFVPPVLAESGHTAFLAQLSRGPTSTSPAWAVIRASSTGAVEVAAVVGAPVGGTLSGVTFAGLSAPSIRTNGDVLFPATMVGTGVTSGLDNRGYFRWDGSARSMVLREGRSAAESPWGNYRISALTDVEVVRSAEAGGELAFKANFTNQGSTTSMGIGQFLFRPGMPAVDVIAKPGATVPGEAGLTFGLDAQRVGSSSGPGLLTATLAGTGVRASIASPFQLGNDQSIWQVDAIGSISQVLRVGSPARGWPDMYFYTLYTSSTRPIARAGGVWFAKASVAGQDGTASGSGIWTNRADVVQRIENGARREGLVIRSGDPAREVGTGLVFGSLWAPFSFNNFWAGDDGSLAFIAPLLGPGVTAASDRVICVDSPVLGRQKVARGGEQVPGMAQGVSFVNSSLGPWVRMNNRGDVAFVAQLAGPGIDAPNDYAMFLYSHGRLTKVVQEGDVVANSGDCSIALLSSLDRWALTDAGHMLISAQLADPALNGAMSACLFRVDDLGGTQAWSRTNAWIALANNGTQRISSVNFSDKGMSCTGQIAATAYVLDGGVQRESVVLLTPQSIPPRCTADFNGSGGATVQDVFDFLESMLAGEPQGDFNRDGQVGSQDLFDFLAAYFAGCP